MKLLRCYLFLLVAYTIAVIVAAMIPHRAIEDKCRKSITYVTEQDEYPHAFGLPFLKTDNFTDLLMLNEAWCSDDTCPVDASMMNYFYLTADGDLFEASRQMLIQPAEQLQLTEYSRYWHGIQVILRPLLVFTDYHCLIICNYILLTLLALWCLYEVWRKVSSHQLGRTLSVSVSLGVVLLLTAFPAVPLCFQYSVCFYIMFLFVIAILHSETARKQDVCSFFIVGALTAFFDLLTTPLLTLGIPLLIHLHNFPAASRLRRAIRLSVSWLAGYASLWLSKCLVAWLLTGQTIINMFMEEVCVRSLLGLNTIQQFVVCHPVICILSILLAAVLSFFAIRWLRQAASRNTCQHCWILFVAALPILWYAVLLQHTLIHFFFVWRALAITLLALLILVQELKAKKTLN